MISKWAIVFFVFFNQCFSLSYAKSHLRYSKSYEYDLVAALIFRDEAPYLKEWIEYHKLVGVQHFYLYNNESVDHFKDVLSPYIASGEVELYDWNGDHINIRGDEINAADWNAIQSLAYVDAVKRAKNAKAKWIAIIDSDEFLVPAIDDSLCDLLVRYESKKIGGVRAKWVMYGTSYVPKIPKDQLLIETLLLNEGWVDGCWKSIFRPERVDLNCDKGPLVGPHSPFYLHGWEDVSLGYSEIQCNHYWTRDEAYFEQYKLPRRKKWDTPQQTCEEWAESFNRITPAGDVILRFIPELRSKLGFK